MTTTTQTPLQQAGMILHGLLSEYATDLVQSGVGILETSAKSLAASPTELNLIGQGIAIAAAAPLALPGLESTAIGQFASALQQFIALVPAKVVL
jgi:hypothetical protein